MITKTTKRRRPSSFQMILFGFTLLILFGGALLMLPIATQDGQGASFSDAIFTATSATCVTGLSVRDTALYWSGFGQAVILLLIQIGGMGVITVAVCIALFSGRKISLMQRSVMQESIAAPQLGGIVRLTEFVLKTSLCIEFAGALALYPTFCRSFGALKGIWLSLFHSISAFCNAGFDLMGTQAPGSSLTALALDPLVNITIMLLIIIGGIGFLVWEDFRVNAFHFRKFRTQSKIVLVTTVLLLLLPTAYFYFYEYAGLAGAERLWLSLFQSVTPRTAGFYTADLTRLSDSGRAVMILLMLVGGSPGSTAGGMKTTTLAVLFASVLAVFRRTEETRLFRRSIPGKTIRSAAAVLILYVSLLLTGGIVISCAEGLPLSVCLFESASAICTVGLTLGITAQLGTLSRWILIVWMFLGRIGALTLVFAALAPAKNTLSRYPQERITVG